MTFGRVPARLDAHVQRGYPFRASIVMRDGSDFPATAEMRFDSGVVWPAVVSGDSASWDVPAATVDAIGRQERFELVYGDDVVWASGATVENSTGGFGGQAVTLVVPQGEGGQVITSPAIKGDQGETPTLVGGTPVTLDPGEPVQATFVPLGDGEYRVDLAVPQGEASTVPGPRGLPGVNAVENDTAVAAYMATPGTDTKAALIEQIEEWEINVRNHGVTGDGVTDDTAAINAVIASAAGRTVYFPPGTYLVNPNASTGTASGVGIIVAAPNTSIRLSAGAEIKASLSPFNSYNVMRVTAADFRLFGGGVISGDVVAHAAVPGASGEWGHVMGLVGAHRARIENVTVRRAWGDGIYITADSADVSITGIISTENRRQGLSAISAKRLKISNSTFSHTGMHSLTSPGYGIDLEPNLVTEFVTDVVVTNCVFSDNGGGGFNVIGNVTGVISNCRSSNNGGYGALPGAYGFAHSGNNHVSYSNCVAEANRTGGFYVRQTVTQPITYNGCQAIKNLGTANTHGFHVIGVANLNDCATRGNDGNGYVLGPVSKVVMSNCTSSDDGAAGGRFGIEVIGPDNIIKNCYVTSTGVTHYGIIFRSTATGTKLVETDIVGTYASTAKFTDQTTGGTVKLMPNPNATTPTITSPAADAASLKTAVDAVLAVLRSRGVAK